MVGKEIEVKLKVKDPIILHKWLKAHAKLIADSHQTDYYFDRLHDSFLFIDKNGKKTADHYLRIRINEDGKGMIAYKYFNRAIARKEGSFSDEIETKIENSQKMLTILRKIGFSEILVFKKHRKSYTFRNFQIDRDIVENLGEFVEIEYKGSTNNPDKAFEAIKRLMTQMNISDWEEAKGGYVEIMLNKKANL